MYLILKKDIATGVSVLWKDSYCNKHTKEWCPVADKNDKLKHVSSKDIYDEIVVLGEEPDPDKIDEIIGNTSWTELKCDECGRRDLLAIVQVGEEPDYDESHTANLCLNCLIDATVKLRQAYNKLAKK